MERVRNSDMIFLFGLVLLLPLAACQSRPFQTVTMYDDPSRFVRLEVDPLVGGGHSHPADITTDQLIAVLSGVMIEEPPRFMTAVPLLGKGEEPRRHSAFKETEISFFAPFLAEGLRTATSEEIVTFWQTSEKTGIINRIISGDKLVTSGGMFIDGDELHLMLSNYRSETHYASDPGIGATLDGRSTPLRSIAPQETNLDFEPAEAVAPSREGILRRLFRPDRRELVILFRRLQSSAHAHKTEANDHIFPPIRR